MSHFDAAAKLKYLSTVEHRLYIERPAQLIMELARASRAVILAPEPLYGPLLDVLTGHSRVQVLSSEDPLGAALQGILYTL